MLPELELRSGETRVIGKYGMLKRTYLKEYKPRWYQSMLLTGKLDKHLADVDEQATVRFEQIVKQMKYCVISTIYYYGKGILSKSE